MIQYPDGGKLANSTLTRTPPKQNASVDFGRSEPRAFRALGCALATLGCDQSVLRLQDGSKSSCCAIYTFVNLRF